MLIINIQLINEMESTAAGGFNVTTPVAAKQDLHPVMHRVPSASRVLALACRYEF